MGEDGRRESVPVDDGPTEDPETGELSPARGPMKINGYPVEEGSRAWDGSAPRVRVDDPGMIRTLIGRIGKKRRRPASGGTGGGQRPRLRDRIGKRIHRILERIVEILFPLDHEAVMEWIDGRLLPFLRKALRWIFGIGWRILRWILYKIFPGLERPSPLGDDLKWKAYGCILGHEAPRFLRYWMDGERLYTERRFLRISGDELQLYKVRDISVSSGRLQGLLGVGTVTVISSDDTDPRLEIRDIKDTDGARAAISKQVEEARKARGIQIVELMGRLGLDGKFDDFFDGKKSVHVETS